MEPGGARRGEPEPDLAVGDGGRGPALPDHAPLKPHPTQGPRPGLP